MTRGTWISKLDGADELVVGILELSARLGDFAPALEVERSVAAVVERDDFGEILEEQAERAAHRDDVDGHEELVEHEDTGVEGSDWRQGSWSGRLLDGWRSGAARVATGRNRWDDTRRRLVPRRRVRCLPSVLSECPTRSVEGPQDGPADFGRGRGSSQVGGSRRASREHGARRRVESGQRV